ncbi:MAG: hypothetical protein ABWZ25_11065 [Chitinophagaceae bacterium]
MKKVLVSVLFVMSFTLAYSQRVFFVYLESAEPFFIKLDNRTYASGSSGYIILPGMSDSSYLLRIGFPLNKYPDQLFRVRMDSRDHGFLLENKGPDGFVLNDQQSARRITAEKMPANFKTEPRKVSPFTDLLARATDDNSLRFTTIRIVAEAPAGSEKPEIIPPVIPMRQNQDSVIAGNQVPVTAPGEKVITSAEAQKTAMVEPAPAEKVPVSAQVTKLSGAPEEKPVVPAVVSKPAAAEPIPSGKTDSSTRVTKTTVEIPPSTDKTVASTLVTKTNVEIPPSADRTDSSTLVPKTNVGVPPSADKTITSARVPETGEKDLISVAVASRPITPSVNDTTKSVAVTGREEADPYKPSRVIRKGESSTTQGFGLTFIDEYDGRRDTVKILIPNPDRQVQLVTVKDTESISVPIAVNCRTVATEPELEKTIRKMKSASREEGMLEEGSKLFKSHCISTEQLRLLSRAFPGDGGKLKLFRLAQARVSDPANFSKLETELHDDYFIERFRSLLQ